MFPRKHLHLLFEQFYKVSQYLTKDEDVYSALALEIILSLLCHNAFARINFCLEDMNMKAVSYIKSQRTR
jgi:hypothetical protein